MIVFCQFPPLFYQIFQCICRINADLITFHIRLYDLFCIGQIGSHPRNRCCLGPFLHGYSYSLCFACKIPQIHGLSSTLFKHGKFRLPACSLQTDTAFLFPIFGYCLPFPHFLYYILKQYRYYPTLVYNGHLRQTGSH